MRYLCAWCHQREKVDGAPGTRPREHAVGTMEKDRVLHWVSRYSAQASKILPLARPSPNGIDFRAIPA